MRKGLILGAALTVVAALALAAGTGYTPFSALKIGGGYGGSGVQGDAAGLTIEANGDVSTDGDMTVDGTLEAGTFTPETIVYNVEAMNTAGALGTAPLSDGDGTITMTSVVTAAGLGLSKSSGTMAFDESAALSGDHTLSANQWKPGVNGIIFEGATANTIESYLTVADPTETDKTWTLPNLTGTVALTGASQAVTFGTTGVGTTTTTSALNVLGADYREINLLRAATDATTVQRIGITGQHWFLAEEPVWLIGGRNDGTTSAVYVGGGGTTNNAATSVGLYVAANTTTVAGTERLNIDGPAAKITATGTLSLVGFGYTTGGWHVGSASDPGTDNLIVDGTSLLSGIVSAGSGPTVLTNAAGTLKWAAMETPTIKETIILTAAGGEPTTTAGCAASAKKETTTNKRNYRSLDFDPGTDESAFWTLTTLPDDYAGGTFTVNIKWKAAGTGNVCWSVASNASGHDDVYDAAVGTAVTGTVAVTAVGDEIESSLGAMTAAGTPVAGDSLYVAITRDANNGADTVAGDVELLGASLDYTPKVN